MKYTVQCGFADYNANTVTVDADSVDEACERAIAAADVGDGWKRIDDAGPTFVDAVARSEDDAWDEQAACAIPAVHRRGADHYDRGYDDALADLAAALGATAVAEALAARRGPAPAHRAPVRHVCGVCGGHDVRRDAWARWNAEDQAWDVDAVHDHARCEDCDADVHLVEVPLPTPARIARALDRLERREGVWADLPANED